MLLVPACGKKLFLSLVKATKTANSGLSLVVKLGKIMNKRTAVIIQGDLSVISRKKSVKSSEVLDCIACAMDS